MVDFSTRNLSDVELTVRGCVDECCQHCALIAERNFANPHIGSFAIILKHKEHDPAPAASAATTARCSGIMNVSSTSITLSFARLSRRLLLLRHHRVTIRGRGEVSLQVVNYDGLALAMILVGPVTPVHRLMKIFIHHNW